MKKLLSIAFLLSLFSVQAQELQKSLLWKISGKGIEKPSYIFGTIHITCDAKLSPKVMNALKNTDQLCLEMDMDNPKMQSEMMSAMMMKNGMSMSKLASKEDFELVDAYLKEQMGYSLNMLNGFKPFIVSAMFYPKLIDCKMQSYEGELMKSSQEQKKEIIGLETVEEQMGLFDVIPYQEQMNELIKSVRNKLVNDKKELIEALNVYEKEDLNGIMQVFEKSENAMVAKYNDQLVDNRNHNWIPKIEKEIALKPTFFGVGAGHLVGKNGVILLLRKQGYTVEPVFNN
ncbi:TraB/GumN family protein [Aquirufa sp. ROCK2-A2]